VITPLRCGVDTLEATFTGTLDPLFADELQRRKLSAQAHNQADEMMLCGELFQLLPKGQGLWPYVVRNDDLLIRFGTAPRVPAMSVRLLAQGLASRGVDALWGKAREIARELGLFYSNCTRLDVALDYQGHWFTFEEMLNVACHATFRPVYPNTVAPETYQFGKGDLVVRVYNKSREIEANHHDWWKALWRLSPDYDPASPVYRVEVQSRGALLRELGFSTVEELIESLADVFAYGLEWCSLRVPNGDSNRARWAEDPRWTALRTAFAPGTPLRRVRPFRQLMGYDAAVRRQAHLLATVGAALDSEDYWQLARALTTDAEQLIERELETTFSALVEQKRKRKYL
jgi:hypothetical protein